MTAYKSGPYRAEMDYYTPIGSQVLRHTMKLNCAAVGSPAPGTAPTSVLMQTAGGGTVDFAEAAQTFWSFLRGGVPGATTVTLMNLFRVTPGTDEGVFICSAILSPVTGGLVASPAAAREETLTFRSAKGSYMAIDLQEGVNISDTQTPLVPASTGFWNNVLAYYILSADGWIACRDRSWPVAPMRLSSTQNEHTYKRRFRSS